VRIVSIDIETTGLSEDECDILEFSAVLDDLKIQAPLETLPVFHTYFVKERYVGEPYALSMHKEIFLRIAAREKPYTYKTAMTFGYSFRQFLVKNGYEEKHDQVVITAAGKNFGPFDLQFLKRKTDMLKHVNVRSRILDPALLLLNSDDEVIPGTSECKKRMGLDGKVAHTATEDAFDVIKMVRFALGDKMKK